jgi:outer membrane phospholipase A
VKTELVLALHLCLLSISGSARASLGAENFSAYKPTYAIFGSSDMKMQFSGKYQLMSHQKIVLSYTQLMFWNIYEKSKPFRDINFNPEIFYQTDSWNAGYSHLSNGKSGNDSRSLDRVFFKWKKDFSLKERVAKVEVRLFYLGNLEEKNNDILENMGFWDATLHVDDLFHLEIVRVSGELKIFCGKKGYDLNHGATAVGVVIKNLSLSFEPALYLQYYSGYGEALLNYNERVDSVRAGFLLEF